jgi:LmbE family N-acetylglucosaminyl deacetylase
MRFRKDVMTRLLCIVAHPDDETMLCGGTLAVLAGRGVEIHVLCATRGEGGEMGEPPRATREELGRVREAEMRCACQALGVHQVNFLDYVDPTVGPENSLYPFAEDEDELRDRLLANMRRLRPHILLTHGRDGEYGHPAHKLLHRATWAAFQQLLAVRHGSRQAVRHGSRQAVRHGSRQAVRHGSRQAVRHGSRQAVRHGSRQAVRHGSRQAVHTGSPYLYTFCAAIPGLDDHIFNESEPADLVFELEGTPWLDRKEAAALCHVTQHALFKRRKQAHTVREILRRVESLHRYWPVDGPDAPELREG